MRKFWNILFLVTTIIVCLLTLELGFRAIAGVPVFAMKDWRLARVIDSDVVGASQYDSMTGWNTKAGIRAHGFNTIRYGIRKNAESDTDVRPNGVLVIGDSFAAGSQVDDEETWPAQLESMIHEPVLNAAVGGWGFDQMMLRIDQLYPAIKPKVIIVASQDQGILRQPYTSYGRPKPYYTLQNGTLVPHNIPVPHIAYAPDHRLGFILKRVLSYSYIADQVIGGAAPGWWYTDESNQFYKDDEDPAAVSCALVKEMKKQSKTMGFRLIFVLEYGGQAIVAGKGDFADKVDDCIRANGVELVDTFDMLRAISLNGPEALKANYVMVNGEFGHMSALGNRRVAEMIAASLASPEPAKP